MKPYAAVVALVAFLAAGCGGASSSSGPYTLAATKQCLVKTAGIKFAKVGPDDFVASTASNGSLRIRLPDSNAVTMLVGGSANEASNLSDAYRRFRAANVGIEDVLRTENNVVLLWQLHPSLGDENTIHRCLK